MRKIVDNGDPASLAARYRRKRFELFMQLAARAPQPVSVLDVGGEQRFWEVMGLAGNQAFHITLLNVVPQPTVYAHINSLNGDAADLSRFDTGQFDIVFSNSVIEHLGSFERQQHMASEVQRVGRSYFVQTPNRGFPLEPHFLLPWFQFYPEWLQVGLLQRFRLGWYERIPERGAARQHICQHRLMNEAELRQLFPGAHIYRERALGMIKSLVAISPGDSGDSP